MGLCLYMSLHKNKSSIPIRYLVNQRCGIQIPLFKVYDWNNKISIVVAKNSRGENEREENLFELETRQVPVWKGLNRAEKLYRHKMCEENIRQREFRFRLDFKRISSHINKYWVFYKD